MDERSIRKWESGKKKLPADVIDALIAIDELVTDTANKAYNAMIREALQEPLSAIIETVTRTLERTEPELAADLVDNGVEPIHELI